MAQEIGERAVPLVAAGFRDDVDEAAVGPAGLHAQAAGADLELLDGLERDREVLPFERSEELAEEVVREVGAVDVQREVVARLTGDAERAARAGDRPRGRRQQGEVAIVTPVDRQARERVGVDHRAERRRRVAGRGHRHGLGRGRRSSSRRSRRGPGRRSAAGVRSWRPKSRDAPPARRTRRAAAAAPSTDRPRRSPWCARNRSSSRAASRPHRRAPPPSRLESFR